MLLRSMHVHPPWRHCSPFPGGAEWAYRSGAAALVQLLLDAAVGGDAANAVGTEACTLRAATVTLQ